MWEIRINRQATGILVDDNERAVALAKRRSVNLVIHFMQTLDSKRWNRFKQAREHFRK